jgi:hypothetical protein
MKRETVSSNTCALDDQLAFSWLLLNGVCVYERFLFDFIFG